VLVVPYGGDNVIGIRAVVGKTGRGEPRAW
jgi:hypothetical protein